MGLYNDLHIPVFIKMTSTLLDLAEYFLSWVLLHQELKECVQIKKYSLNYRWWACVACKRRQFLGAAVVNLLWMTCDSICLNLGHSQSTISGCLKSPLYTRSWTNGALQRCRILQPNIIVIYTSQNICSLAPRRMLYSIYSMCLWNKLADEMYGSFLLICPAPTCDLHLYSSVLYFLNTKL